MAHVEMGIRIMWLSLCGISLSGSYKVKALGQISSQKLKASAMERWYIFELGTSCLGSCIPAQRRCPPIGNENMPANLQVNCTRYNKMPEDKHCVCVARVQDRLAVSQTTLIVMVLVVWISPPFSATSASVKIPSIRDGVVSSSVLLPFLDLFILEIRPASSLAG